MACARAKQGDEPDWNEEMNIFAKRISRPNQLATLRELEGKALVGKVRALPCALLHHQRPVRRAGRWSARRTRPARTHKCWCCTYACINVTGLHVCTDVPTPCTYTRACMEACINYTVHA